MRRFSKLLRGGEIEMRIGRDFQLAADVATWGSLADGVADGVADGADAH